MPTPVAEEYVPAEQSLHVDALSAPRVSLHLPAPHRMHIVLAELANLPASQAVQLVPAVVLT